MCVLLAAYGLSFHVAFGHVSHSYYDFAESLFSLFSSTLGEFDIDEVQNVNRYLAPFLFVSFIVVMLFVVLSMLVALVKLSYHTVREKDAKKGHEHEHEIIDDLLRVFEMFVGAVGKLPVVGPSLVGVTNEERERTKAWVKDLLGGVSRTRMADDEKSAHHGVVSPAKKKKGVGGGGEGGEGGVGVGGADGGEEDGILVKDPKLALLRELVEIEHVQKTMLLTGIEELSKLARAAAFDRLNKQIEAIVSNQAD